MSIDRCVCANITFAALLRTAQSEGLDFAALGERTRCCRSCALCEPYVRQMLATGQTSFPVRAVVPTSKGQHVARKDSRPPQH